MIINSEHRWIDNRLGQLGIDVRQPHCHERMRLYIKLLQEEISITERFMKEYTLLTPKPTPIP